MFPRSKKARASIDLRISYDSQCRSFRSAIRIALSRTYYVLKTHASINRTSPALCAIRGKRATVSRLLSIFISPEARGEWNRRVLTAAVKRPLISNLSRVRTSHLVIPSQLFR